MALTEEQRKPLALAKNIKYPTYQLYAQITKNNLSVERQFKLAVLEVIDWLKERFREFDEPPFRIIKMPKPTAIDQLDNLILESFKSEDGYNFDIEYIEHDNELYWAFQLLEPDIGLQDRGGRTAVLGRTFETNVAFHLKDGEVECGCKINCAEPNRSQTDCEVFRPAFIKRLINNPNLGLSHCGVEIKRTHTVIDSIKAIDDLRSLIFNINRQLPIILVTENNYVLTKADIEDLSKPLNFLNHDQVFGQPEIKLDYSQLKLEVDPTSFASRVSGFALVYQVPAKLVDKLIEKLVAKGIKTITGNQLTMIAPLTPQDKQPTIKEYQPNEFTSTKELRIVADAIKYHKHNDHYNYGEILFLKDAKTKSKHLHHQTSQELDEWIKRYEREIQQRQAQLQPTELVTKGDSQKQYIRKLESTNQELEDYNNKLIERLKQTRHNLKINETKINLKEDKLILIGKLIDKALIPDLVDQHLKNTVVLHQRARKSLEKCEVNLDLHELVDGILYLDAYCRNRRQEITLEALNEYRATSKYNWTVTPSGGDATLAKENYEIEHYYKKPKGTAQTTKLDLHIKLKNLYRLYCYYDEKEKMLVIGDICRHLPTRGDPT